MIETNEQSRATRHFVAALILWMAATVAGTVALAVVGCGGPHGRAELGVTSVSPEATAAGQPIRVQFDRPVVGADQVGVALADPPVALEPAAPVSAHWMDRQTLVIAPAGELRPSTRYTLRLTGELGARSGGFTFQFVHRPLVVEGVWGVDLAHLPPRPALPLHFDQPVEPAAVAAGCTLRDTTDPGVAVKVEVDRAAPDRTVVATPTEPLRQGHAYQLTCEGLIGLGGDAPLAEPYRLALATYPALALTRATPGGWDVPADEVDVELVFATPVGLDAVRASITSKPAIPGLEAGWLDETRTVYRARVDLETTTVYRIGVAANLVDVYGQRLGATAEHEFRTGDARPRLSVETGIYTLEPSAPGYPVWTRNVRRFDLACAAVPADRIVPLLTSDLDYDPWYDASNRGALDWKKLGLTRRTRRVDIAQPKNKWHLDELALGSVCGGKGSHGLYLAELTSPDVTPDESYPWRYRPYRRVLANVTDMGILLKAGASSGLVWVASISTGKPIGGARVVLYSPQGKQVFAGTTDQDGILRVPGAATLLADPNAAGGADLEDEYDDFFHYRSQRLIGVVTRGDDLAVIDGNWANGIQTWNFGVKEDRRGGERRIRGFIQSDRGIYRPGETVHFKGLVRAIALGKAPEVPRGSRVKVHVEDSRGSRVYEDELPLSRFGGFAFDLALPEGASLGDYHVTARVEGQFFRERFSVEEFRKLSFEVDVTGGERHRRLGEALGFQVDARYLFGAPVAGAEVEWVLQRRPHVLRFRGLERYGFADWAADGRWDAWYWGDSDGYLAYVSDGAGSTDGKGQLRVEVRDSESTFEGPQDYLLAATVRDQTDQTVTKRAVVTAHQTDVYVGLHAQEMVQAVNMPFAVNVVAVGRDGKRVATRARLQFLRQRWDCEDTAYGYRTYRQCKPRHEVAFERDVDVPTTGAATERLRPDKPGEYIVRVSATDGRGKRHSASSFIWVLGPGEAFWSGDESARMALIASKDEYRPGDTARLVPRTDLRSATALVTIERDGVLDAFVRPMNSPTDGIDLAITEAHAPNVFASVAMITGRTGEGDRARPRFKLGLAELKVSSEARRLKVEIEPERDSYQPGEEVKGTIRITQGGKPVRAEVALSVADEGVLQLIGFRTPDPMAAFYASWGLGIDNSTTWNRIARLNDPTAGDPDAGGDGPGAEGQRVRSRFVSSAYWAPALLTDERGEARFAFTAPDDLTTFRLMAVAADAGSRFGKGERRLVITKRLLAQPILPRFFTSGDRADIGLVVHNRTGAAGTARVTAKATGARLGRTEATVELAADGSARVVFPATVGDTRSVRFELAVTMGGDRDALVMELPVGKDLVLDHRLLARGQVGGKEREVSVPLTWSAGIAPADSAVLVSIDRTGLAELEPGLRYLVEYPYGCLEQTLSRFIPLVAVENLAGSLGLKELEGPKLAAFLRAGAAKVARHQHPDGHFSLWPSGPTYPHLTVYALYGLVSAKRAGVEVDEVALERGRDALRRWVQARERTLAPNGEAGTLAMAAYVLAELGAADHGLEARLFDARRGLPRYGQAFLLRALHRARADKKQLARLTEELVAAASKTGDAALVREVGDLSLYMSSDVRTTALTLSALLEVEPGHALVEPLVEGLKQAQRASGRWNSTQDTLYALVALADYARRQSAGSASVTVSFDGKRQVRRRLQGAEPLVVRLSAKEVSGPIRIESKGRVNYTVRATEATSAAGTGATRSGFAVERTYLDPKTSAVLGRLTAGQLVTVRLTVETPTDRRWVALVDPLPAGLEAVNPRLATSDGGQGRRGWHWTHTELRDDQVQAFADYLPAGRHVIEYVARATLTGTFQALPPTAEAMYDPAVFGRGETATVVITK